MDQLWSEKNQKWPAGPDPGRPIDYFTFKFNFLLHYFITTTDVESYSILVSLLANPELL